MQPSLTLTAVHFLTKQCTIFRSLCVTIGRGIFLFQWQVYSILAQFSVGQGQQHRDSIANYPKANYGSIATASWSFSDYVRDSLQDRYTMVYASVNITDSEGINTFAPINSIVPVFATFCNLNLQKLTVLTKMNHPLEDQIPPQKTLSKWKPWSSSALPIDNRMNISVR